MPRCTDNSNNGLFDRSMNVFSIPDPFVPGRAPYPYYYETKMLTRSNVLLTLRPIKRDDAERLLAFFDTLSQETIFFRFLTNLKSLPLEWVRRFTDIDYLLDVAMIAVKRLDDDDQIVGVCRIMREGNSRDGEIAVVVGDAWQGQGIGTMLLTRSLRVAGELGFRRVWGLVSAQNKKILFVTEKLGFTRRTATQDDAFEIELNLDTAP